MSDFDIIKSTDMLDIASPTGKMIDGKKEYLLNANLIKPIILYSPSTLGNSIKYNGKDLISHINASLSTNSKPKVWYEVDSTRHPFGSSSIQSICYGDGKFVAVGGGGKIAYSIDGINWTEADSPFGSSSIDSICYGDRKFVAGGSGGKIAYSINGINWTEADSPFISKTFIESICYGNGKFVAVGWYTTSIGLNDYLPQGTMAYSTDGVNWTSIDSSPFGSYYIYSVCYGDGKFVAGGGIPSMTITQNRPGNIPPTTVTIDARAKMAYSTDGITWTEVDSTFGSSRIYSIYHGNGKFVAGGTDGKMASSTDGSNWTEVDSPFGSSGIHSTYYGNGNFIAGGGSGKMAYSSDGITWTAVADSAFGSSTILSICYGNRRYVAVGGEGKMAYCQVGIPE